MTSTAFKLRAFDGTKFLMLSGSGAPHTSAAAISGYSPVVNQRKGPAAPQRGQTPDTRAQDQSEAVTLVRPFTNLWVKTLGQGTLLREGFGRCRRPWSWYPCSSLIPPHTSNINIWAGNKNELAHPRIVSTTMGTLQRCRKATVMWACDTRQATRLVHDNGI